MNSEKLEELEDQLLDAIADGDQKTLKECIAKLPDINAVDVEGRSLLHNSILSSCEIRPEMIAMLEELLRAGCSPNIVDRDGLTALHRAADFQSSQLVRLLLKYGASPVIVDCDGRSAVWSALGHPIDFSVLAEMLVVAAKNCPERLPDQDALRERIGEWDDRDIAVKTTDCIKESFPGF